MAIKLQHIWVIFHGVLFFSSNTCSQIIFYDSPCFEGPFHQSTATETCKTLSSYGWNVASSIKTDQCILASMDADCWGTAIKIVPGEYPDLKELQRPTLNFDNALKSFRLCPNDQRLNVDFRSGYSTDENYTIVPVTDLCGCLNLPLYSYGKVNSLGNIGNCVKLYSELDCRGSSIEIPGGWGPDTWDLSNVGFDGVTKSVSGCGSTATCVRLSASIQSFSLKAAHAENPSIETEQIAMSHPNIFDENNGPSTVYQEYEATAEVDEILTVYLNPSMRHMYKSSISENLTVKNEPVVPYLSRKDFTSILSSAYSFSNGPVSIAGEKFVQNKTRFFSVTEKIEILPCTRYRVASYVKYVHNHPAEYEVIAHITGVTGSKTMNAEQIKVALGDELEYVEDLDNNTVIVRGNGTIAASFGLEGVIVGEATKIPTCNHHDIAP